MRQWQIARTSSHGFYPDPKIYLDRHDNIKLDFSAFDRQVEADLAVGVENFSLGLAYTGAGNFAPWTFDWRVQAEGEDQPRRIWINPVDKDDLDAQKPENRQARKWFKQFLAQYYSHLEEKGWTRYFWMYAADEPHRSEWVEPLKRYLQIVKEVAQKLRIMMTKGPTDAYGGNLDVACIMMNHLRADTADATRALNQELWCYSCGHLNNPALTINQKPVGIRLWFWLQEKWNVKRVLLWHTSVHSRNFLRAGADGLGDGHLFWFRKLADGTDELIPSIRAEMLRDGVEDREYFHILKTLTEQLAVQADSRQNMDQLARARELCAVPEDLANTQFDLSRDVPRLLARRRAMADMIEQLGHTIP